MKVSYDWLCDFLALRETAREPDQVAGALARIGFTVEGREEVEQDVVLDLEIPANRPDCLNHLGIARELAAHYGMDLRMPDLTAPGGRKGSRSASIRILDPDLCPRYTARLIETVSLKDSPEWLQERLERLGQRPINNIVDITNFVMLHIGQPLHAFDFEKLENGAIVVRRARPGEKLTTLDGLERETDEEMLMICDAEKPVAIAGIMGGIESEVGEDTSVVLLESAYFDPLQVRRTARRIGMSTEASYRFERGSDPDLPPLGLNLASRLIEQIAEGSYCSGPLHDEYPQVRSPASISLTSSRIRQVTGIEIEDEKVDGILESLGFEVSGDPGNWEVAAPTFRNDVRMEEDLVEEVLRHYGYDQVESDFPGSRGIGSYPDNRNKQRRVIEFLTGQGFSEAVTLVFTVAEKERKFGVEETQMVGIENPLSDDHTHLRTSLFPGLLEAVRRNTYRGSKRLKLFEIGKVFRLADKEIREETRLGIVATGLNRPHHWRDSESDHDFSFFHLKGVVGGLLERLGQTGELQKGGSAFLETQSGVTIGLNGRALGIMGRLSSHLHQPLRIPSPVYVAELSLDVLYSNTLLDPSFRELARYPSVESDVSFLVDTAIDFDRITIAVQRLNIPELRGIDLIDLYRGPELPGGKISLTVRLTFANLERTLTQDEANRFSRRIFAELAGSLGVETRL